MKVLIIEDSVVFRTAIKSALLASSENIEIDVAANGKIGLEKLKLASYDVVTCDIEMPVMDGIETITEIRKFNKYIPIIVFSAQNMEAAKKTLKALEVGANDFVKKIEGSGDLSENLKMIESELVPRFKALVGGVQPKATVRGIEHKSSLSRNFKADLLCIGSSTGGPDVLKNVFKNMRKLNIPVLLVQHMPPVFTTQLANMLDLVSPMHVKEAVAGEVLEPGVCYLAPGDYHMRLVKANNAYKIALDQSDKVCYVRPAVDVMLDSVCEHFDGKIASVIFTGMGNDGANGCVKVKAKEGLVLIQDEASSVVWGMPKAVHTTNAYDEVLPPDDIVQIINKIAIR